MASHGIHHTVWTYHHVFGISPLQFLQAVKLINQVLSMPYTFENFMEFVDNSRKVFGLTDEEFPMQVTFGKEEERGMKGRAAQRTYVRQGEIKEYIPSTAPPFSSPICFEPVNGCTLMGRWGCRIEAARYSLRNI